MSLPTVLSTTTSVGDQSADLLGVLAFSDDFPDFPQGLLRTLDELFGGSLRGLCADEAFAGKPGQSLILPTGRALPARRLALVGAGSSRDFAPADAQHPAARLARLAAGVGARTLAIATTRPPNDASSAVAQFEALATGARLGAYRFDKYRSEDKREPRTLGEILLLRPASLDEAAAEAALSRACHLSEAIAATRDLVNEPASALTPAILAATVTARAQAAGLDTIVLGPDECRARGMGLLLAVARGSEEEPRLIHLAHRPANPKKRVVLVGKGVTFDSGGLSLKTTDGMLDMKSDMAGAAAVLNAVILAAVERFPLEVHAVCPCTENMPSGRSYKLGDVITSASGKTVEITNADAEGRLILADAITYALGFQPDVLLDFATLTGACITALGPHTAGVMTNSQTLSDAFLAAGRAAGEDLWPLPLPPRLQRQLKSNIADLRNTGERWGGALIAGHFLKEFVGSTPWIHVDIAGPAMADKEWGLYGKGATGFGVASIFSYLRSLAATAAT